MGVSQTPTSPTSTTRMMFSYVLVTLVFTIHGTSAAPSGCVEDYANGDYDYNDDDYSNDYAEEDYRNLEGVMGVLNNAAQGIPKLTRVIPEVVNVVSHFAGLGKEIFNLISG